MRKGLTTRKHIRNKEMNLLCPALHHLSEQGDAVQVDELLCKGDVPGRIGQVLQSFQLSIHAR